MDPMAPQNDIPTDGVDDSRSAEELADPSYGEPWGDVEDLNDIALIPGRDYDPEDDDPEDDEDTEPEADHV
jgi:hypothetical protein